MKNLVILGYGAGGTMVATKMREMLNDDWKVTVIDRDRQHHYQPGWLFIPFGVCKPEEFARGREVLSFIGRPLRFFLIMPKQHAARI